MLDLDTLVLESKHPQLQYLIKGPYQDVWKDGFPTKEQKVLVLQFERYICEVAEMARDQEWNEEERDIVAKRLQYELYENLRERDFWKHEPPKPAIPWPTYDQTHHSQIAMIAKATGTVEEALVYETRGREDGPRESVVKKLEELRDGDAGTAADEDALAAAL